MGSDVLLPEAYASYLIRLWHGPCRVPAQAAPHAPWQAEIEHIQTGQRWMFDTLDDALSFFRLQATTDPMDEPESAKEEQS
jgi:hypothetical protein